MGKTLLYDVPVRASLTFEGFSPEATGIASLDLGCQEGGRNEFRVAFREVPLIARPIAGMGAGGSGGGEAGSGGVLNGLKRTLQDQAVGATQKALKKWTNKLLGEEDDGKKDDEDNQDPR